jgi:hypothetical protein
MSFDFWEIHDTTLDWYSGFKTEPIIGEVHEMFTSGPSFHYGKVVRPGVTLRAVQLPHWFLVVLTAAFTVIRWMKWRFSLRTLLIATTLVAVALGAIVLAARK